MKFGKHTIDKEVLKSKSRFALLLYFREIRSSRYLKDTLLKGYEIQHNLCMSQRTYDGELAWLKSRGYIEIESLPSKGIKIKSIKLSIS